MADEVHSGLADPIEHVIATNVQRDEIGFQFISHDGPPFDPRHRAVKLSWFCEATPLTLAYRGDRDALNGGLYKSPTLHGSWAVRFARLDGNTFLEVS